MLRNNTDGSSVTTYTYYSKGPGQQFREIRVGSDQNLRGANICSNVTTTTIVVDFRVMSLGIGVLATIALAILGVLLGVGILLITNPGVIAGVIIGGILAATALPYGMGES